jgi:hypothetical protein
MKPHKSWSASKEAGPPVEPETSVSEARSPGPFAGNGEEERGRRGAPPKGGAGKTLPGRQGFRFAAAAWVIGRLVTGVGAPQTHPLLGRRPTVARAVRSTTRAGGFRGLDPGSGLRVS